MAEAPPVDMMKEEIPPVAAAPEELKAPEEPKAEAALPKEEVAQEIPPPAETVPQEKFGPPDVATGMAPEEPGAPTVEPLEAAPAPEAAPEVPPAVEPEAKPTLAQMTDYSVQRGDTLWRIAEQARADNRDVSIEQMILAIYRTNQDAFFGNNVNNLKAGKILKMPERAEVESTTTSDARREFRAQYSAWQEYKLRLASASGAVQVPEAPEVAPEAPAPTPPAPEPVKEAAKPSKAAPTATDKVKQDELLKIVRSTLQQEKSTPDQKVAEKESAQETATREQQALADRAATLEESLESRRLENKELSDKVGVVRSQLSKESRLIELESQGLAQQPKPAEPNQPSPPPSRRNLLPSRRKRPSPRPRRRKRPKSKRCRQPNLRV